jgi:hypothetical protein
MISPRPRSVGRKTRCAHGCDLTLRKIAPVLSRSVGQFLRACIPNKRSIQNNHRDATRTARLKSGAGITFADGEALDAPRFSPYRPWANTNRGNVHAPIEDDDENDSLGELPFCHL